MYDRAPRVLKFETVGTSDNVGPGKYNPYGDGKVCRLDGYAPFLSMAMRDSFLTVKDSAAATPGPSTYCPKICDNVIGGSTLANRSNRFSHRFNETPGPGCYTIAKDSDWIKNTMHLCDYQGQIPRNVKYQRKSAPSSIPSPGQACGYEEDENGTLQKQKIPQRDSTLGPAYYKINEDDTMAVKKYKGIHFGSMTSKRIGEHKGDGIPGPGTYNPYKSKPKAPIDYIIEEQRRNPVEAKLPRYHEVVAMTETKKAVPGPGHYKITSQFSVAAKKSPHRPSFGAQAKRFSDADNNSPAPGLYDDPRHALEICKRTTGMKRSPFGQTATRFDREHHVRKTPGPGRYNHADLATDLKKKAILSLTAKGGFGTAATRTLPLNAKEDADLPGPADYVIKATYVPESHRQNAIFESGTERMNGLDPKNCPSPGSYDFAKSFDRTQGKVLYGNSKSKKINGGFLSSTKRFSQARDVVSKQADLDVPGPGQYDIMNPESRGGSLVTYEERFKETSDDTPGPGTYQLSPLIQHSVLKNTFNTTLDNPVDDILEEMEKRKARDTPVPSQ